MKKKRKNIEKISDREIAQLKEKLAPLLGVQIEILKFPKDVLKAFEPSQIGTIVGAVMDASIPELASILPSNKAFDHWEVLKHEGILGDREGYPDYKLPSGKRLELKLLYVDPEGVEMKKPPTPREPSARLTQKVTIKNVDPRNDVLLIIAYQLQQLASNKNIYSPTIIDFEILPAIDCVLARDQRLAESGGRWFGNYETPCILSNAGREKLRRGIKQDTSVYGRKESEGKDFNEDTNFGKLKRIPYKPLQLFLKKHGASYSSSGNWPSPWEIPD